MMRAATLAELEENLRDLYMDLITRPTLEYPAATMMSMFLKRTTLRELKIS